ncbi:MAG: TIGR01906 family membrane protein [Dehalococcoidia bacterium]|nr:TIGR01906 family membrane protein [Dehalococcoidia bacterium]
MRRYLLPVLSILFLLAVPVFLVTNNVMWAFNESRLYSYGFTKYNIPDAMFMPMQDLERIAADLRTYFRDNTDLVDIRYVGRPFYNEKEVAHLKDVKALVKSVSKLRRIALAYILGFAVVGFIWRRDAFSTQLSRLAIWAGGITLALLALAGLAFLFSFDSLFILFHQLSFANDFWQLDPARDNLVRMFPEGFWFDAAMLIVVATVLEAATLTAAGFVAKFVLRRMDERLEAEAV